MKDTTTTSDTASRRPTPAARGGRPRRRKLTFDRVTFFLAFLGVPLAIFVTFVLIPFIQAIYWGMTDWRGFSPDYNFVGLDNFTKMFQDDIFMKALRNVALLAVFVPLVTLTLALGVAVAVTLGGPSKGPVRGIRGASFYRIVSFFPYVVPAIIVGLIWAQMYDPNAGLVNGVLTAIGLDQFDTFAWLGETASAMPALMFVIVWGLVGFYAVLFIAAIKGVPAELYEAARIDGAGRFRTTISITLPAIRDTCADGVHLPGHRRPRRVRLRTGDVAERRPEQLDPDDQSAAVQRRLPPSSSSDTPPRWASSSPSSPWCSRRWCSSSTA